MTLLVAARGDGPGDGLYLATDAAGGWQLRLLDTVEQLAALCRHPSLPVVYGLSGLARGRLLAWEASGAEEGEGRASRLAELDCLGEIPCDLAVDPTGRLLVAANYGGEAAGGSLTVWTLDAAGVPLPGGRVIGLAGSGLDHERQGVPHPHQIVFDGEILRVPDLGAECIRRYRYDGELEELTSMRTPPGTGPRHLVVRYSSPGPAELVVSGELGGTIVVGSAGPPPGWRSAPSSARSGAASTRSPRNYPGDVKISADGRFAYLANRGYDTIAAFALDGGGPRLAAEVDARVAWPQHLLVRDGELLVAGWDGSAVMRHRLVDGVPAEAELAFECPGAGWLLEL